MGTIKKFEDIEAWKKARDLVKNIYRITEAGKFGKDYSLKDQTRRAATSIMLNIAEGFARKTNKEFRQFLFIAHGSAAEIQAGLYVALDQHYIEEHDFKSLYEQAEEVSRLISGFIKYLSISK